LKKLNGEIYFDRSTFFMRLPQIFSLPILMRIFEYCVGNASQNKPALKQLQTTNYKLFLP